LPETEEKEDSPEPEKPPKEKWRFYFIDLWILGIVGGFCFIMILRERKKSKGGVD